MTLLSQVSVFSMNKKKNIITNAVISAFCFFISGGVFASTSKEINHLLNFVSTSPCKFERNGSIHLASKAVDHIKKKYNYYEDDIKSAEDFINLEKAVGGVLKRR